MNALSPIRPEIIAGKLAAIREISAPDLTEQFQKTPRLAELLWFLQYISRQPGGLAAFVKTLVAQNAGRIGTKTMRALACKKTPWNCEERRAVCEEMPGHSTGIRFFDTFWSDYFPDAPRGNTIGINRALLARQAEMARAALADAYPQMPFTLRECETARLEPSEPPAPDPDRKSLKRFDRDYFAGGFQQTACEDLPGRLARFSQETETTLAAPTWFPDLVSALIEAMDAHAAAAANNIVMTAVALKVFDALDYAVKTRSFVHVQGEARFGKTEAIKTWCDAHPGLARLVRTPSSNSDADLFRAVAESLGIDFSFNTSARELKSRVEYVIRHGGLALVFDEAHFLFPQRYSADTAPSRLNWLRTEVIDRQCPVALVSTPQSYGHHSARFVKKTGYNFGQFIGRKMLDIPLPDSLDQDDLLAVAQFHFPALDPLDLELIVAKAMQSEAYIASVEAIAQRAQWIAARDGHPAVTFEDVELAIAEVIPSASPAPAPPRPAPALPSNPIACRRPRPIRPAQPVATAAAAELTAPARHTSPTLTPEHV